MRTPILACLLTLLVLPGSTEARIRFLDWRDSPQRFANQMEAIQKLKRSFGDELFERLRKSRRVYTIVFETDEDFERAMIADDDSEDKKTRTRARIRVTNAYFEKDVGTSGRFTFHLNKNALERLKQAYLEAHPRLNDPKKRRVREQILRNVISNDLTDSLAHEARHARQTEDNELAFLDRLVAPKIHDGLAHDRYDEREGYLAGLEALLRPGAEEKATASANRAYAMLPARFLVVREGQEVVGEAPFAWGASDAKTSMSGFVTHLLADQKTTQPAAAALQSGDAKSAGPPEGVELEDESPRDADSDREDPDEASGEPAPSTDDAAEEVDPDWVSPNGCGTFIHGELGDFPIARRRTADAKTSGEPLPAPRSIGTDPSASKMDPEPEAKDSK